MITDRHYGFWTKRKIKLAPGVKEFIGYECSECHYISLIRGTGACPVCKATMSERISNEDKT